MNTATDLPYVRLDNYKLDNDLLLSSYRYFKDFDYSKNFRSNGDRHEKITTMYGHENVIESFPDLVEYKERTLQSIAKNVLQDIGIDTRFNCYILETAEDSILEWHKDEGWDGNGPTAAFMYKLDKYKRAPTVFDYNDKIYTLDEYSCAIINTSTLHKVDNTKKQKRLTFRISLYDMTFEDIRNIVLDWRN